MKNIQGTEAVYRHKTDDTKLQLGLVGRVKDFATKEEKYLVRELGAGISHTVYVTDKALLEDYELISSRSIDEDRLIR